MNKLLKNMSITAVLLAISLAAQLMRMPQLVTGTVVNTCFIICILTAGLKWSLMLSLLTPLGGWIFGILPPPLFPMIPLIVVGNFFYCWIFKMLINKKFLIKIIVPALAKTLAIGIPGYFTIKYIIPGTVLDKIFIVFASSQLPTAILGLILALIVNSRLTRK
ncbi:MAG: ECF transporter S component [Candidatus Muiribacteriota bacterium]